MYAYAQEKCRLRQIAASIAYESTGKVNKALVDYVYRRLIWHMQGKRQVDPHNWLEQLQKFDRVMSGESK